MSKLPSEQPPAESPRLREYLSRMMTLINGAISTIFDLEVLGSVPSKAADGVMRFFGSALPPSIDYAGPWIVVDGVWRPMVSMQLINSYVDGLEYYAQEVVVDGDWTMVANKTTTDSAAPDATGDPSYSLPDEPPFITASSVAKIISGGEYLFSESGWLSTIRVWTALAADDYVLRIINLDDGYVETIDVIDPIPDDWTVIASSNTRITSGVSYRIELETTGAGSNDYSEAVGYWPGNYPSWATVTGLLSFDDVDQGGVANNAYGVDVELTTGVISPDWDILSRTTSVSTISKIVTEIIDRTTILDPAELLAFSDLNQVPAGLDIPLLVEFGAGGLGTNGNLSLSALGVITCVNPGDYGFRVLLNVTRDNSALSTRMIIHIEVNGVNIGYSEMVELDSMRLSMTFQVLNHFALAENDTVEYFITRDSTASDDGSLVCFAPAVVGIPKVHSSYLIARKSRLNPP